MPRSTNDRPRSQFGGYNKESIAQVKAVVDAVNKEGKRCQVRIAATVAHLSHAALVVLPP